MKKIYLSPVTETVNVKLYGSILEDGIGVIDNSYEVSDDGEAKENNLVEDEEILPTQPNLWDDEED